MLYKHIYIYINGLAQDLGNSIADDTLELLTTV